MNDEKRIRKLYGEKMWHLCRDLFSTLLETPGLLSKLLEDHFNPSRFLYNDIIKNNMEEEFKDYIYSFIDVENNNQIITNKSVRELLNEAGYEFYECHTEEEIQAFKRYYAPGEELCTFRGGRLDRCYVFFVVKKDVENIKRENFSIPNRQDEYGTSVMSIQFTRGSKNTLSIKNRYNHTVNNPDATFNNNLDNIIPGLTQAFEREYGFSIMQDNTSYFELDGYVQANDGKWYKYNYEINNIYYCPDNIIIDNFEVINDYQEKEKYLILDYFILDLAKKEIRLYDNNIKDSFVDCNKEISKIDIINIENGKQINLIFNDGTSATIIVDRCNNLVSYENNYIKNIEDNFLIYSYELNNIQLNSVETLGRDFLNFGSVIRADINCPSLKIFGQGSIWRCIFNHFVVFSDKYYIYNYFLNWQNVYFLPDNIIIDNGKLINDYRDTERYIVFDYFILDLVNKEIKLYYNDFKDSFIDCNKDIETINVFNTEIGRKIELFFKNGGKAIIEIDKFNRLISYFNDYVETIGNNFLIFAEYVKSINLSNVKSIGHGFIAHSAWPYKINCVELPNVSAVGDEFVFLNDVDNLVCPNLTTWGEGFHFNTSDLGGKKI